MTPGYIDTSHLHFLGAPPSLECARCRAVQKFAADISPYIHAALVKAFVLQHRLCLRVA